MPRLTFEKERVSFNIARLKKKGHNFEIVVNPDLAIAYRNKQPVYVRDVLLDQKIFSDAKKGMLASENAMLQIFNTSEQLKVAETILKEGDVHLTAEYKAKLIEEKKNKIINIIHRNGFDPRTNLPHPVTRIRNAFEEAKVRISEFKRAEEQVHDVLKALRPILPIRFEVKKVEIRMPAKYAGRLYPLVRGLATVLKKEWQSDGSLHAVVEIPGGLEQDFYDKLNSFTHGSVETKALTTK